jgi:hypothetical protein
MRSFHLVTPGLPGILVQPTADWMRQAVHLYGDDGNLIGENIGWVDRYDGGKQWKGFTRYGALPFRRSRPDAARDVLREWCRRAAGGSADGAATPASA